MKILFATDGSESARAALDFVQGFPFPEDSEIILLTVIDKNVFKADADKGLSEEQREALQATEKTLHEEGEQLLTKEADRLRQAGWAGFTQVRTGHPAKEIVDAAETLGVDLVILGSHGLTGIKHYLLGSVSSTVLEYAPCSVLIFRKPQTKPGAEKEAQLSEQDRELRLLLAYDDSGPARKAVDFCAALPLGDRVHLVVLTVLPLVTLYRQDIRQRLSWFWHEKKRAAQDALHRVTKEVRWATPNVSAELRESSDVSHAVQNVATELNSDLIVLGHKGKGAIEKFLLGSVTTRIARHAPCSVLAVRK
ncbi:MAG: universal stress protein [Pseudomonadota bacterium]|nr:universal stress protein [Pseudomonadota bacterium]